MCQNIEAETEVHFILKCPFHIFHLADSQYPNSTELIDYEQLKVIFQTEDLIKKTASFRFNRMCNGRFQIINSN